MSAGGDTHDNANVSRPSSGQRGQLVVEATGFLLATKILHIRIFHIDGGPPGSTPLGAVSPLRAQTPDNGHASTNSGSLGFRVAATDELDNEFTLFVSRQKAEYLFSTLPHSRNVSTEEPALEPMANAILEYLDIIGNRNRDIGKLTLREPEVQVSKRKRVMPVRASSAKQRNPHLPSKLQDQRATRTKKTVTRTMEAIALAHQASDSLIVTKHHVPEELSPRTRRARKSSDDSLLHRMAYSSQKPVWKTELEPNYEDTGGFESIMSPRGSAFGSNNTAKNLSPLKHESGLSPIRRTVPERKHKHKDLYERRERERKQRFLIARARSSSVLMGLSPELNAADLASDLEEELQEEDSADQPIQDLLHRQAIRSRFNAAVRNAYAVRTFLGAKSPPEKEQFLRRIVRDPSQRPVLRKSVGSVDFPGIGVEITSEPPETRRMSLKDDLLLREKLRLYHEASQRSFLARDKDRNISRRSSGSRGDSPRNLSSAIPGGQLAPLAASASAPVLGTISSIENDADAHLGPIVAKENPFRGEGVTKNSPRTRGDLNNGPGVSIFLDDGLSKTARSQHDEQQSPRTDDGSQNKEDYHANANEEPEETDPEVVFEPIIQAPVADVASVDEPPVVQTDLYQVLNSELVLKSSSDEQAAATEGLNESSPASLPIFEEGDAFGRRDCWNEVPLPVEQSLPVPAADDIEPSGSAASAPEPDGDDEIAITPSNPTTADITPSVALMQHHVGPDVYAFDGATDHQIEEQQPVVPDPWIEAESQVSNIPSDTSLLDETHIDECKISDVTPPDEADHDPVPDAIADASHSPMIEESNSLIPTSNCIAAKNDGGVDERDLLEHSLLHQQQHDSTADSGDARVVVSRNGNCTTVESSLDHDDEHYVLVDRDADNPSLPIQPVTEQLRSHLEPAPIVGPHSSDTVMANIPPDEDQEQLKFPSTDTSFDQAECLASEAVAQDDTRQVQEEPKSKKKLVEQDKSRGKPSSPKVNRRQSMPTEATATTASTSSPAEQDNAVPANLGSDDHISAGSPVKMTASRKGPLLPRDAKQSPGKRTSSMVRTGHASSSMKPASHRKSVAKGALPSIPTVAASDSHQQTTGKGMEQSERDVRTDNSPSVSHKATAKPNRQRSNHTSSAMAPSVYHKTWGKWVNGRAMVEQISCLQLEEQVLANPQNEATLVKLSLRYARWSGTSLAAILLLEHASSLHENAPRNHEFWNSMGNAHLDIFLRHHKFLPVARFHLARCVNSFTRALAFMESMADPLLLLRFALCQFWIVEEGHLEKANDILHELLQNFANFCDRDRVNLLFFHFQILHRLKMYAEAVENIDKIIAIVSQSTGTGATTQAAAATGDARGASSSSYELLDYRMMMMQTLQASGDYVQASSIFSLVLSGKNMPQNGCLTDEQYFELWHSIAEKCFYHEDYALAGEYYPIALNFAKESHVLATVHHKIGLCFQALGENERCVTEFKRARNLNRHIRPPVSLFDLHGSFDDQFALLLEKPVRLVIEEVRLNLYDRAVRQLQLVFRRKHKITSTSGTRQRATDESVKMPSITRKSSNMHTSSLPAAAEPSSSTNTESTNVSQQSGEHASSTETPVLDDPNHNTAAKCFEVKRDMALEQMKELRANPSETYPTLGNHDVLSRNTAQSELLSPQNERPEVRRLRSMAAHKHLGYFPSSAPCVQYWVKLLGLATDLYMSRHSVTRAISAVRVVLPRTSDELAFCALADALGNVNDAIERLRDSTYQRELSYICSVIDVQQLLEEALPVRLPCISPNIRTSRAARGSVPSSSTQNKVIIAPSPERAAVRGSSSPIHLNQMLDMEFKQHVHQRKIESTVPKPETWPSHCDGEELVVMRDFRQVNSTILRSQLPFGTEKEAAERGGK